MVLLPEEADVRKQMLWADDTPAWNDVYWAGVLVGSYESHERTFSISLKDRSRAAGSTN